MKSATLVFWYDGEIKIIILETKTSVQSMPHEMLIYDSVKSRSEYNLINCAFWDKIRIFGYYFLAHHD
uniref:Uncharacterized protein n=1 Tax=Rhizophora mucronata TaxID=61149 RepID=A0A2P2QA57_RHIMU